MVLGEVFLSAFLQVLFDRLASRELLEFARREGLDEKLKQLEITWSRTRAVLDDAEERQHNNLAVKLWLDDLKDFADDVEDMLDEYSTDALRENLKQGKEAGAGETGNPFLILACATAKSVYKKFTCGLRSKITEIIDRFNNLMQRKDGLNLREIAEGRGSDTKRETLEPTSVPTEPCVYGREKETQELLQLLLSEQNGDVKVTVITILGMGGIGKTTLAQQLYHHDKVQSEFKMKAWVYVSEDFDTIRVTKAILTSLNPGINAGDDLNSLQVELIKQLKGKKFLVILDDLWNENYHEWKILHAPFQAGALGSRIVITTRHREVASTVSTFAVYPLQGFSNDACFSLFTRHALGASNFSAHPNLIDIGEKIVHKCKGLPLAAKTLGGLLCTKRNRGEWEEVLNSEIWDIEEKKGGILPYLILSYHHLPYHLKRCFQYCSLFPKGYEFVEEQLVLLWMAEGLIIPCQDKKQEVLGRQYFRSMLSRSFFQPTIDDNTRFLMHDFINDLARYVARDTCYRLEDTIDGRGKFSKRARHFSCLGGTYDGTKKFEALFECTSLRTFLPLNQSYPTKCYLFHGALKSLPNLRYLRVLSLCGYYIVELPHSIGHLKLLRYLNLSNTSIKSFPEFTTPLCNLQTLILQMCPSLEMLPSVRDLVKLRHLNILHSNALEGMPQQMGKLTCLQKLSNFVVAKSGSPSIKELGPLMHLQGILRISKLENVIEPEEAWEANLIGKPDLEELEFEWSISQGFEEQEGNRRATDEEQEGSERATNEEQEGNRRAMDEEEERKRRATELLDMLQPHKGLKKITLRGYHGTKFPTWLSCPSFSSMVLLCIQDCKNCTLLPPFGQPPSLESLSINRMDGVKNIGLEFYGAGCAEPFRSLKTLRFMDMKEWEKWEEHPTIGEFPHLRVLSIQNCSKLVGRLPINLPSLEQVTVDRYQQLGVAISTFPAGCNVVIEGSEGLVHESRVDFSTLHFQGLSTITEFNSPPEEFNMEGLTNVKNLTIESCEDLGTFWSSNKGLLQHLPCLCVLKISHCANLVSLFAEEVEGQLSPDMSFVLRELHIRECKALISLPRAMMHGQTCLQEIQIIRCNSLRNLTIDRLPPTLKRLHIENCENMRVLLDEENINGDRSSEPLLESLTIFDCPSLDSLTLRRQLPAAKFLSIEGCKSLKSIAERFECNSPLKNICILACESLQSLPMGMCNLSHLEDIHIQDCSSLECFPDEESLPANLRNLRIISCGSIKGVPNRIHSLTALQVLVIRECPGIVCFPAEGFPPNLKELNIRNVLINEALFERRLQKLTSLERLEISTGRPNRVSFPRGMLPASLSSLTIHDFPKLTDLSSIRFQTLKSLEVLQIKECEKLTSFAEHGLPPSLKQLVIYSCSLLDEHCKKRQGPEWHKLAHVLNVYVDGELVYRPGESTI